MSTVIVDDRDPPTEVMGVLEGVTTAGAPASLSLQHLHSLRTTLEPLRAAYANAAVDRLRGLPSETRRTLLPHVLEEHPELASEPRIRAMAEELRIDVERIVDRPDVVRWLARISGVRVASAEEALERIHRALDAFAEHVAELAHVQPERAQALPTEAREVMREALDPDTCDALAESLATLTVRMTAAIDASHEAAHAVLDANDLAAVAAQAVVPGWWPSPFREARLWSHLEAHRKRRSPDAFDEAFSRAYLARVARAR